MFVSEIIDKSNNQLRYDYLGNIRHFRRHWLRCAFLFTVFGTKPVKNVQKPYHNNIIYTTENPLLRYIILDFTKKLGNTFEATSCKIAFLQELTFGLPFYRNSHQPYVEHRI